MKYFLLIALLAVFFVLATFPAPALADETHVNIKVDPRGMSDEYIKLKTHEFEMEEKRIRRFEEKADALSIDALRIGELYLQRGEYDTAVFYFQKAIYYNDGNVQAHARLIEADRDRDAVETSLGSHYHRAMEYYRKGMKQKAIEELVAAIKENPDDEAALIKLNEIESKE